MDIKIRYNTDKDKINSELPPWRVLINGVEHLAEQVICETRTWTTHDMVEQNKLKWHLSCEGIAYWDADHKICTIKPS